MPSETSQKTYDIVTFGDLCVDLIVSGADVTPQFGQVEKLVENYAAEMGGSCSIFACQAARLGLRTGLVGRVGPDIFGELVTQRLQECGVDTRHVRVDADNKTGLTLLLCKPDDRAMLTCLGALNAVGPEDIPADFLASARHLHHGSYFLHTRLRPHIPQIFSQARALGVTVSLDTNWDPDESWGSGLRDLFPLVDVFFPNEQEALRISQQDRPEEAGEWLVAAGIQVVVIKRGEKGALLVTRSEMIPCQVVPAESGGDGIGAGDSFDAGFLAGWLRGLPLETCLKIACQCGRAVAGAIGGTRGQLSFSEVFGSR